MPVPALSLVGFMNQQKGESYLQQTCIPANPAPVAITADWQAAQANLGAAIPNAGHPALAAVPAANQPYVQQMIAMPWFAPIYQAGGWNVQIVEIDPLLAFQFHVATDRAAQHVAGLVPPLTLADILPVCLPLNPEQIQYQVSVSGQSALIRSKSLNLRLFEAGAFPNGTAGIHFGPSLPHVQVSRFNGRCYLSNGFHRAFGLRGLGGDAHPLPAPGCRDG